MTISLSASPSPSGKLQSKTRRARRKKSSTGDNFTAPIDRRKRPRYSPPIQSNPEENNHATSDPSSPPSEFIKFLPVDALIRYLDHHYLLNSPINLKTTSPSSEESKDRRNQLIDDYNRFALLVSSNLDHLKSNVPHDPNHQSSSSHQKSSSAEEQDRSPSISPSTSIAPSSARSQETSPTQSSTSFYKRLFSSSVDFLGGDLDIDYLKDEQNNEKSKPNHLDQTNSLFKFDKTLLNLVLNHHHQSFPTLVVKPMDDSISMNKCSPVRNPTNYFNLLPSSPSSSPSSIINGKDRTNQKTGIEHEPSEDEATKNEEDMAKRIATTTTHPEHHSQEKMNSKKANLMTLDQHGFVFKIHINDPSPSNNNNNNNCVVNDSVNNHTTKLIPPDRHLEILENHVLSNFVYSVKTRGNALRPK